MDDIPALPAEKAPPFKPPLITPSASPPVSRLWQRKDKPPLAKRPRLSSTPSSLSSAQPPSSSSSVSDLRLKSSNHLFEFWNSLAERYTKHLDEDDIVDFREFKIIKDRGVVRSAARSYGIGSLLSPDADPDHAASQDAEDEEDEGAGDAEGEGEDDSADELDLISPPTVPVKLEYYKTWVVPPADEKDPEDAKAFREFEEADKRQRELYGDVDEDEEDEDLVAGLEAEDPGDQPNPTDAQEAAPRGEHQRPLSESSKPMPQHRKSIPPKPAEDESSDDELAVAEVDETPIPPRRSGPRIIDSTDPRSRPSVPPHRGGPQSRPPGTQNRAPPRARSKTKLPTLAAGKRLQTPQRPASPEQVVQLLTPPRSSSFAIESVPISQQDGSPASRAETPSPKFPKARPRYTPRPRTPSEDGDDVQDRLPSLDFGERTAPQYPFPVGPPKKAKKKPRPKPEVVITTSHKQSNGRTTSVRLPSPERGPSPSIAAVKRKKVKGKGKDDTATESTAQASTSKVSKPRRSQSQPRASTREPREESGSPQPPPPFRGTKRRRVSSLSSLSDSSPTKAVTPERPPAASSSARRQHNMRSSSRSGYSSDVPHRTFSPIRADDEDGGGPPKDSTRSRSRASSLVAPPMPPQLPPLYPPMYAPYGHGPSASSNPRHAEHGERLTPFPTPQDPQSQYAMAQAAYYVSYLMSVGAFQPPPPAPGPGYPPGGPFSPAPWPPYTPNHPRHHTIPPHVLGTPSSQAGPSRPATYSTSPHHPHPYPYLYDPRFSNSTLPPSSPIPSSPASSSPILRPASVALGQRSRSRGRRVSFKLDDNDRPLTPSPPPGHDEDSDEEPSSSRARRAGASASASGSGKSSSAKGKGKARAEEPRCEEEEESEDEAPRGRLRPRACTPGPPSQRERSVPHTSTAASSSSTKERKSTSKRKG